MTILTSNVRSHVDEILSMDYRGASCEPLSGEISSSLRCSWTQSRAETIPLGGLGADTGLPVQWEDPGNRKYSSRP